MQFEVINAKCGGFPCLSEASYLSGNQENQKRSKKQRAWTATTGGLGGSQRPGVFQVEMERSNAVPVCTQQDQGSTRVCCACRNDSSEFCEFDSCQADPH